MFEKSGNVYRTQNVPKLLCRVKWFGHGNGDSGHIYICRRGYIDLQTVLDHIVGSIYRFWPKTRWWQSLV